MNGNIYSDCAVQGAHVYEVLRELRLIEEHILSVDW